MSAYEEEAVPGRNDVIRRVVALVEKAEKQGAAGTPQGATREMECLTLAHAWMQLLPYLREYT